MFQKGVIIVGRTRCFLISRSISFRWTISCSHMCLIVGPTFVWPKICSTLDWGTRVDSNSLTQNSHLTSIDSISSELSGVVHSHEFVNHGRRSVDLLRHRSCRHIQNLFLSAQHLESRHLKIHKNCKINKISCTITNFSFINRDLRWEVSERREVHSEGHLPMPERLLRIAMSIV